MILNLCGFGWSGSGAYHDLLKEYDGVCSPTNDDWEFSFIWLPDGLYDLEYKLCKKHCRIFDSELAIKRFLEISKIFGDKHNVFKYDRYLQRPFYDQCKEYVDKLIQFKLKAYGFNQRLHPTVKDRIILLYNKVVRNILPYFLAKTVVIENYKQLMVSYNPSNFLSITQDFVESILSQIRSNNDKILLLNQSLPPDQPNLFDHFFKESHKTIIIRRDPRDTFITIKKLTGKPLPVPQDVNDFIVFYRKTIAETIIPDSDLILSLNFEDIIYNYEETVAIVENFANPGKHISPFSFFDPKKSINNTQLKYLYPEFKTEIEAIERELSDFLYPFEKYDFKRTSNKIF